jgi:hypothetical protein
LILRRKISRSKSCILFSSACWTRLDLGQGGKFQATAQMPSDDSANLPHPASEALFLRCF